MIRREVADLREGDVVELLHRRHPDVTLRGPVRTHPDSSVVYVGDVLLMNLRGELRAEERWDLTVVSRAPRPLYVNHPRTEAVVDDIVNYGVGHNGRAIGPFMYTSTERWAGSPQDGRMTRWVGLPGCHPDTGPIYNAGKLRLLVDGETGQVIP